MERKAAHGDAAIQHRHRAFFMQERRLRHTVTSARGEGMARFGQVAYVSSDLLHVYSNVHVLHHQTAEQQFENI
ncbi:hypothetical protein IG631_03407 [Alternaria alternata]|nr:hypothetical protein IG631_03407 [Alternaria alternata]